MDALSDRQRSLLEDVLGLAELEFVPHSTIPELCSALGAARVPVTHLCLATASALLSPTPLPSIRRLGKVLERNTAGTLTTGMFHTTGCQLR